MQTVAETSANCVYATNPERSAEFSLYQKAE